MQRHFPGANIYKEVDHYIKENGYYDLRYHKPEYITEWERELLRTLTFPYDVITVDSKVFDLDKQDIGDWVKLRDSSKVEIVATEHMNSYTSPIAILTEEVNKVGPSELYASYFVYPFDCLKIPVYIKTERETLYKRTNSLLNNIRITLPKKSDEFFSLIVSKDGVLIMNENQKRLLVGEMEVELDGIKLKDLNGNLRKYYYRPEERTVVIDRPEHFLSSILQQSEFEDPKVYLELSNLKENLDIWG